MDVDASQVWRRVKYAALTVVLTIGLTAATAVALGPEAAGPGFPGAVVPLISILGLFVVTPLVLFFGVPVAPGDGDGAASDERDPLERLRDRYAAGEISEAEFDRKVERLLETEPDRPGGPTPDPARDPGDGPLAGTDPERDRGAEAATDPETAGTGDAGTSGKSDRDPERESERETELEPE